jgi:multiple antibiotic resistance protein
MFKMVFDYTVSLFVIIDPFVSLIILLSLLPQSHEKNMIHIAFKSSLAVFIGSSVCILLGGLVLKIFGVDVPSFKIMGGVILLLLAIQMVQARISGTRYVQNEADEARRKADISISPLAIPGTLGPGTITTILIYRNQASWQQIVALFIAVLINCVILYIVFVNARRLEKALSKTALNVFTRLMGLVVGSIAFQFIVSGAKELWFKP